jgi:hypothetical protein
MCTFRGGSRTLSAGLTGEISHFYMYLEIMKRLADNIVCVHSGELPRHYQPVLAGEISHFYMYLEIMKTVDS